MGVLSAILAMTCYAVSNVLIDRHVRGLNPFAMLAIVYAPIIVIAWTTVVTTRAWPHLSISLPTTGQMPVLLVIAAIIFVADLSYFASYKLGASMGTITMLAALLPVAASLIRWKLGGPPPTAKDCLAWILAITAVYLVASQSSPPNPPISSP